MDYTFQDEDDAARRNIWIFAMAVALAIVVGAILLLRANSRRNAANEPAEPAPVEQSETAGTETAQPETPRQAARDTRPSTPAPDARPRDAAATSVGTRPVGADLQSAPAQGAGREAPPPPAAAGANARALLAKGQDAERADDLLAARAAYEAALASSDIGEARALVESRLGAVMVSLITSQRQMPEKIEHAIASGDRIERLARTHGTTADLIAAANGISNPNNIRLGDRLRILHGAKFEILVSKSQNWLLLKMNGKFFKRYTVGTGRYNRTPIGTFVISDKIKEPSWWKDNVEIPYGDERNILGTRWMAISATGNTPPASGYGIHGTWDNSSLGQQSSAGCVRMANTDVEELFMIVPKGTPVTIQD
ncbi:MAG: L,D-transpeptidase family protein [Kiritimatiellae bacterium]|nr:L,D-transpeptidase family protein [Kiritimatiellia bacterium]